MGARRDQLQCWDRRLEKSGRWQWAVVLLSGMWNPEVGPTSPATVLERARAMRAYNCSRNRRRSAGFGGPHGIPA
eukprot:1686061-Pyramimonas_sp.AAC.1